MILFRADANSTLGTGHVMRCLTIAQEFRNHGHECIFVTADDTPRSIINERNFQNIVLHSDWKKIDGEVLDFLKVCEEVQPDFIFVDHYYADANYLQQLKKVAKVVYIDDLNEFYNPADVIINYNIYAELMNYRDIYAGKSTKLLLGPKYAPLREEFRSLPAKVIKGKVTDILISTGGADPVNVGLQILQAIASDDRLKGFRFHYILGALNANKEKILSLANMYDNIIIHQNVQKMSLLMQKCDVAISAAGSTQYELCACGVPTICYVLADNQIPGAKGFLDRGLMRYAGDCRDEKWTVKSILNDLKIILNDKEARLRLSSEMQHLIDGKGSENIRNELENNC